MLWLGGGFTLLRRTVRRLGDEFLSNDVIFPVARLCRMLERHAAQGGEEPEWAVETLLAVGGDAQVGAFTNSKL